MPNVRSSIPRGPTSALVRGSNLHPYLMAPYQRCCHGHLKLQRQCLLTNDALASLPFPLSYCVLPNPACAPSAPTQAYQVLQPPATTPCPTQMPLAALQAYLRVPPVPTRAFHSSTVPPAITMGAPTISAVSPVVTDLGLEEGGQNTSPRETRPPPTPGPEAILMAEQMRRVMGDTSLYRLTGTPYASAKPAEHDVCDKSLQIPGRVLPPPAALFRLQSVPRTDSSGHFTTIHTPPRAGVAAAVPHPRLPPP
ncbi:hypothetical protein FS749_004271 [Ceratobasidium sp. UAMH 11750]|nr:hypothetical protein FS749_004271 [Ceratobasidium sp. UAMH 11750]